MSIGNKTNGINIIAPPSINNPTPMSNVTLPYTDIVGQLALKPEDNTKYLEQPIRNVDLDSCKTNCDNNYNCNWLQHDNKNNICYLYSYYPKENTVKLQWKNSEKIFEGLSVGREENYTNSQVSDEKQCHKNCDKSSVCLYSIYDKSTSECKLYNEYSNKDYTLSFSNNLINKLNQLNSDDKNSHEPTNKIEPVKVDDEMESGNQSSDSSVNVLTLYCLTIIILVLVAIILCIFKRRSDREKMLLYALSNASASSQSRSRSKSSPSENMSYLNSGSYSYFGNTFNASSITINPDTIDSQKHSKSHKKSRRKSNASKAPSVHSISTLCNISSQNQGDTSQNEKSNQSLSLSTKKSSYNYSIKTFSAKDPSLTGLSQNIKTLFANSYNGVSDTNSYYETFSTLSTGSPRVEPMYDSVLYKDNINSNSIKKVYSKHKKQTSSISITIPKMSNNSVNVSPKNNYNGGSVVSINSPQQPKVIKVKKPVHTKQFSISRSVYSEPVLPISTTCSEISIHDDLDGISYIEPPQDPISFNANGNTTRVK